VSATPLDWLIVGGGIHGTYLSHVLLQQRGVPRDRVRVLDPHEAPLAYWDRFTRNTGMQYLRSPAVHHLDFHPNALRRFAKRSPGKKFARFVPPYERPGIALFREHNRALVEQHGLADVRIQERATGVACHGAHLRIETPKGALEARNVVLALGLSEQPCIPEWASSARKAGVQVDHIFDGAFRIESVGAADRVLVVGGGITAAQVALSLTSSRPGRVTLVLRHALRKHQFDSDPGWLGPKNMTAYSQTRDLAARRRMIAEARNRGSVPPEVFAQLRRASELGLLDFRAESSVAGASRGRDGDVEVRLESGERLAVDRIVLATGFLTQRPGGEWLTKSIEALGLSCAGCGYPIVDAGLRWLAPTGTPYPLFVSGPLAELELGPSARNIIGARHAGERIVHAA
jgi:glycine/D-amino acid oxidase-like deaminating enzyme